MNFAFQYLLAGIWQGITCYKSIDRPCVRTAAAPLEVISASAVITVLEQRNGQQDPERMLQTLSGARGLGTSPSPSTVYSSVTGDSGQRQMFKTLPDGNSAMA